MNMVNTLNAGIPPQKTVPGKDFAFLKQEIARRNADSLAIYGCGTNGEVFLGYLRMWGANVDCFIDRQAEKREFEVLGKPVRSPSAFINDYKGETVIVSPDNHSEILSWLLKNGIPEANMIVPFAAVPFRAASSFGKCSEHIEYEYADMKQGTPKCTVFSIVYNTPELLLRRAIESVLHQTERNFTYLIIDNGSTDGSREIISQYAKLDRRIVFVAQSKNLLWTNSALLELLRENTCGKYVCMLDSDDYYEGYFLEKTLAAMEKYGVDLVQVNTLTYSEDDFKYSWFSQTFRENLMLSGSKLLEYFLLRILSVTFWGKLYTTDIFKKLLNEMLLYPADERHKYFCLDVPWMTYIACNVKTAYLCDEILHVRTWRKGSSEFSSGNITRWLAAIVWSVQYLKDRYSGTDALSIFSDAAFMWLFSLSRPDKTVFLREKKLFENAYVQNFLSRPVCDSYKA